MFAETLVKVIWTIGADITEMLPENICKSHIVIKH